MTSTVRWFSFSCIGALLTACGGGGGGGSAAPAHDLTGFWQLHLTPAGSTTAVGPLPIFLQQNGAVFDGVDVTGAMNGAAFSITADGGAFVLVLDGTTTSADAASGSATFSGAINGSGTFQLTRFAPAGSMDATGSLDGNPIAESSTAAIGIRTYADAALTSLAEVTVALIDGAVDLQLTFQPSALGVGTLAVPSPLPIDVLLRLDGVVVDVSANGGNVTLTSYDNTGIAGTYTVDTAVGSISGSFDVAFDIASFSL